MSFGRDLQLERENRGVSLEELAQGTKVPSRFLCALEADNFSGLPGGVFNKGIVSSYCRHLGIAEESWLARFAASTHTSSDERDWGGLCGKRKAQSRTDGNGHAPALVGRAAASDRSCRAGLGDLALRHSAWSPSLRRVFLEYAPAAGESWFGIAGDWRLLGRALKFSGSS